MQSADRRSRPLRIPTGPPKPPEPAAAHKGMRGMGMEAFPSLFLRTGQGRVHLGFHRTAVCIADVGKPEGLFQAARLLPPPPVNVPAPGPNPENMTGASNTAVLTPPRLPATSGQGPLQHRQAFAADQNEDSGLTNGRSPPSIARNKALSHVSPHEQLGF